MEPIFYFSQKLDCIRFVRAKFVETSNIVISIKVNQNVILVAESWADNVFFGR